MFSTLEQLAIKFFSYRRQLMVASAVGFVVLLGSQSLVDSSVVGLFCLLLPLVAWPWGLLMLTGSFHPTEGYIVKMDGFPGLNVLRAFTLSSI